MMNESSGATALRQRVVRAVLWSSAGSWGRQVLSFALYAALARIVGPDAFGVVALAGIYISLTEVFVSHGLGTALVQRKDLEAAHIQSAFWLNVSVAVVLVGVSFVVAGAVAALFGEPRLTGVLRWLSCSLLLTGLTAIPSAILTRGM